MNPDHQKILNDTVKFYNITFESAWCSEILLRQPVARVRLMEIRFETHSVWQLQKIIDLTRDTSWMQS